MGEKQLLHVTKNGNIIDFLSEDISGINLYDVLDGLGKEHRYANRIPWTVLQHSIVIGLAAQELYEDNIPLIQKAFTHDFQECVVRDVPTPFKDFVGKKWYEMENMVQCKLLARFGIDANISAADEKLIYEIDKVTGYVEACCFFEYDSEIVQELSKNAVNFDPIVVITVTRLFYRVLEYTKMYDESGILSEDTIATFKDVIVVKNL